MQVSVIRVKLGPRRTIGFSGEPSPSELAAFLLESASFASFSVWARLRGYVSLALFGTAFSVAPMVSYVGNGDAIGWRGFRRKSSAQTPKEHLGTRGPVRREPSGRGRRSLEGQLLFHEVSGSRRGVVFGSFVLRQPASGSLSLSAYAPALVPCIAAMAGSSADLFARVLAEDEQTPLRRGPTGDLGQAAAIGRLGPVAY